MGFVAWLKTQFICQLLLGYVFLISGFIINFVQLLTLVLWPIDRQLYRRVNCRLAYSLWSQLVMVLEHWSGTECTLFAEPGTVDQFGKEHAIVVLNHNYEVDFLCGWTMCERYGVLGASKVLAKRELLKVPLIGWTWYFLEIVFCKRRWEEDRQAVLQGLHRIRDYPEYVWFLLYCEGTRFTEKKHRISMEVAKAKGLPKLKHHLLPRTKGFTTTVHCLRGMGERDGAGLLRACVASCGRVTTQRGVSTAVCADGHGRRAAEMQRRAITRAALFDTR